MDPWEHFDMYSWKSETVVTSQEYCIIHLLCCNWSIMIRSMAIASVCCCRVCFDGKKLLRQRRKELAALWRLIRLLAL